MLTLWYPRSFRMVRQLLHCFVFTKPMVVSMVLFDLQLVIRFAPMPVLGEGIRFFSHSPKKLGQLGQSGASRSNRIQLEDVVM